MFTKKKYFINKNIFIGLSILLTNFLGAVFKFSGQNSTLQLSGENSKIILSTPISNFNGTLKIQNKSATSLQQTTTSDRITFADGVYQTNTNSRTFITATIDPATTDKIILTSGQTMETDNGAIIEAISIVGAGNTIKGQPTFNSPIVLQDSNAEVIMSIQSKLNQNITTNGGTVVLGDDLSFEDGVFITGNGTIDVNEHKLTFPPAVGTHWTNNLTFLNANDIELSGYTYLDGTWTFSGTSGTSFLNGNGNILDLANSGTITIDTNHSLYISDVHLKNVGTTGGSILINATGGNLYLSNVILELSGNYNLTEGTFTVHGNNCVVVARSHDNFNITSGGVLVVDGVVFLYDPLGTTPLLPSPIVASSGGTITYLNSGVIRSNYFADSTTGNIEFTLANEVLPSNHILAPASRLIFLNSDVGTPKTITLDGQGFFVQFNYSTGQYMTVAENVTVVLKNMLLKDFDPALISFAGSGGTLAKIVFEDNVTLSLNKDLTLSSRALVFQGNSTIKGNGTTMSLAADAMLTATGTSKVLTIQDTRLFMTHNTAMKNLGDTTKMVLQDSKIHMTNIGYTFGRGHLDIRNQSEILGLDPTSATGSSTFSFTSKGLLRVQTNSMLKLDTDVSFLYNPDITADVDAAASKRHVILNDPSSTVCMNSSIMTTGTMGFALDYGRLLIDGKTEMHINSGVGAEAEFGSALTVEIAPSGTLDVNGALKYILTTYP